MRKPHSKKAGGVHPVRKLKERTVPMRRKSAQQKWIPGAQMPNYLAEEHPELCN